MRGTIAEPIHDPAAPMTRPVGPWPERGVGVHDGA